MTRHILLKHRSCALAGDIDARFSIGGHAQSDGRGEKIQRYLQHLEANNKFMGSVALSIDGKQILDKQVGHFANSNQAKLQTKFGNAISNWIGQQDVHCPS